ncbi:retinol dehydrogenase 7-like [Physella acuta]|uniref:retinol dehydrogenase 7-like n=1 Tax=Physella acuta TaxID=109671 RepID=UPI0027DDF3B9|nr:retinol dehydrogenase 7-like [Physella acuta]
MDMPQDSIRLDGLGFHVFAGCHSAKGTAYLSSSCSKRVVPIVLELSQKESIDAALQVVMETLPENTGLWGLVNNAAVMGNVGVSEICNHEDYTNVLSVNLLGTIEMSRTFLPLIRLARGRLVNASSVCGRLGVITVPYTVSKYGLEAYSDIVRRELYNKGVKVVIVEPGGFKTRLIESQRIVNEVQSAFERSSDEVKLTYRPAVNRLIDLFQIPSQLVSTNLDLVVDAYIHGLTSRYPKTRYIVGMDAWCFFLPLSYLPTCISDWMLQAP